jgi:hypothetical protein
VVVATVDPVELVELLSSPQATTNVAAAKATAAILGKRVMRSLL